MHEYNGNAAGPAEDILEKVRRGRVALSMQTPVKTETLH